ncbi:MAG TPA: YdeI/OmpD-associated family protein [Opitutaceae bacterium]|nr:YdeI/OmpD-associated family protein [Opitutaceae bacterium]
MSRSSIQRFSSVIESAGGGGAFVSVPFDVESVFGKGRVPVECTIDGEPYRGSLVRMGGPCHVLPVLKRIREEIGKGPGDTVDVVVQEDTKPRVVAVPSDLARALRRQPQAGGFFRALSYTGKKEYVRWIEAAKRDATRESRIARAIAMLTRGRRAP